MNTRISYLYRDASNYKMLNEAIVHGSITKYQIDIIMGCLKYGENFIPSQIGLPEKRFGELTEDDHCWFELQKSGFASTEDDPGVGMTVDELVKKFLEMKGNWDDNKMFGKENSLCQIM